MYRGKTVGVVVTAYDEEDFVGRVIETVPDFVDRIYAVDDASPDDSWAEIQRVARELNRAPEPEPELAVADGGDDRRVVPIRHEENRGYGAAVKTGYERAAADGIDVVAVMNGDGQMDPEILDRIVDPVATGEADYAKGNRLLTPEDREAMSTFRYVGNVMLSGLSKFAAGYWSISDPQNGYTAISREAVETLDFEAITDRYGFLNHVLTHLNVHEFRVADVPMRAVYGDEESSIRYGSFVQFVSLLLLRSFCWRLKRRYVVDRFHPAVVFYGAGSAGLLAGGIGFLGALKRSLGDGDGFAASLASLSTLLVGATSLGAAIALDAAENADLETRLEEGETDAGRGAAPEADAEAPRRSTEDASAGFDRDASTGTGRPGPDSEASAAADGGSPPESDGDAESEPDRGGDHARPSVGHRF